VLVLHFIILNTDTQLIDSFFVRVLPQQTFQLIFSAIRVRAKLVELQHFLDSFDPFVCRRLGVFCLIEKIDIILMFLWGIDEESKVDFMIS